jgi:hypothetical protein
MGIDLEKRLASERNRLVDEERGRKDDHRERQRWARIERLLAALEAERVGGADQVGVPGKATLREQAELLLRKDGESAWRFERAFAKLPWPPRTVARRPSRARARRRARVDRRSPARSESAPGPARVDIATWLGRARLGWFSCDPVGPRVSAYPGCLSFAGFPCTVEEGSDGVDRKLRGPPVRAHRPWESTSKSASLTSVTAS